MFWLTLQLYRHLRFSGGRKRTYPIPPRVCSETQDLLCGDASRSSSGVEENCEGAHVCNDGTSVMTMKATIAVRLGLPAELRALTAKLTAAGLTEKRNGSVRVFIYAFPTEIRPKAVCLKTGVEPA